jgi:hypothetical protein
VEGGGGRRTKSPQPRIEGVERRHPGRVRVRRRCKGRGSRRSVAAPPAPYRPVCPEAGGGHVLHWPVHSALVVMSQATQRRSSPVHLRVARAVSRSASSPRATSVTETPSRDKASLQARPSPLLAPDTIVLLPCSPKSTDWWPKCDRIPTGRQRSWRERGTRSLRTELS